MKYLAIDYGTKRIGVAVCDPGEIVVSPYKVIPNNSQALARIVETIDSLGIQAVVVGLPLNMDGTEGRQARLVQDFAGQLKNRTDLPIHFQDERLTSFQAERTLVDADLTRAKKKQRLDAVAAVQILQMFLEAKEAGRD